MRPWVEDQTDLATLTDMHEWNEAQLKAMRQKRGEYSEIQKAQRYIEIRMGELMNLNNQRQEREHE